MKKPGRVMLVAAVIAWAAIVVAGNLWMTAYSSQPSGSATSPDRLPSAIRAEMSNERPTLLVFLHPYCPCSRATLAELERITADYPDIADIKAYFYLPSDQTEDWAHSDTWIKAERNPALSLFTIDEEQLKELGTVTSGQVMLYDKNGDLVFSGGITPARGHEGDNVGSESIKAFFASGYAEVPTSLVFGCSLVTAD
jgi:hypothetical protein